MCSIEPSFQPNYDKENINYKFEYKYEFLILYFKVHIFLATYISLN